jgi:hypothetical protein
VLQLEVLVGELLAVDGAATGALGAGQRARSRPQFDKLTLPRVKSPPWSMNCGMTRWNLEPV